MSWFAWTHRDEDRSMPKACSHFGIARSSLAGFASALALASLGLGGHAFAAPAAAPVTKAAAVPAPVPAAPVAGKPAGAPTVAVSPSLAARPQGYADLAERLLPMVVNISTSQTLRRRPDANEAAPTPQAPQGSPLDDF